MMLRTLLMEVVAAKANSISQKAEEDTASFSWSQVAFLVLMMIGTGHLTLWLLRMAWYWQTGSVRVTPAAAPVVFPGDW